MSAAARKDLTDRGLKALQKKPAKAGQRYWVMDAQVEAFGVLVNDTGKLAFFLNIRYPGSEHPARRVLGRYGEMTLEEARSKARDWKALVARGLDPRQEAQKQARVSQERRANTFAAVAEAFIAEKLPAERKGKEVEQDIRREFIPKFGPTPITELTDLDILGVINAKKLAHPTQARNLLGTAKRLFAWAVDQRVYGLASSPLDILKPTKIIGKKRKRRRILTDVELFALWRAADKTPYPAGAIYKLLILNALRLNEVADASKSEFDRANSLWVIPAERMKGRNGEAWPHAVPLNAQSLAILDELPKFKEGTYLFSSTFGVSPVWIGDKVKKRIDARMLRTLRALARRRGDAGSVVTLPHWVNHDIRRTVRSNLSRLKVTEEAREAVLAHVRPGIKGTYDLYDYLDEKREALDLWAARVAEIVTPKPGPDSNVVHLKIA